MHVVEIFFFFFFFSCSLNHPKVKVPDQATDKLVLLLLLLLPGNTTVNSGAVVGTTFLSLSTRGRYYIQVTREGVAREQSQRQCQGWDRQDPWIVLTLTMSNILIYIFIYKEVE